MFNVVVFSCFFLPKYTGLCISSYIADKDDAAAVQLDEINQVFFPYSTMCIQMSLSPLTVDHYSPDVFGEDGTREEETAG